MIAACPECGARYRIDGARVGPGGAKLRCRRCEVVFRVTQPPAPAEAVEPAQMRVPSPAPQPAASASAAVNRAKAPIAAPAGEAAVSGSQLDTSRLVLVADPDPESAKATANALAYWGLRPILAHDGVEAIMTVQRSLPRAVILDAALPKMFGFQICEFMKRNQSLRNIAVVLIGAIHHQDRDRRPPNELYGADAYIERPELPDAFRTVLEEQGLPIARRGVAPGSDVQSSTSAGAPSDPQSAMPSASESFSEPESPRFDEPPASEFHAPLPPAIAEPPAPAPIAPPAPAPVASPPIPPPAPVSSPVPIARPAPPAAASAPIAPPAPVAASPAPVSGEASQVAQAERLARIIVSDIVLYNQEKFDAAIVAGNVLEAMNAEMGEARGLFTRRVDSAVRETKDFLSDELIRVARMKGMQ